MNPCFWQYLLPQHTLSKIAGMLAHVKTPWLKNAFIRFFVKRYPVDLSEAIITKPEGYDNFNDFFTRALKPELRPIDNSPHVIISPVDGKLSASGRVKKGTIVQAKNHNYSLSALLATDDSTVTAPFEGGLFSTLYLAPHDYHRVHMPINGQLKAMTYIPGKLFSVNTKTADNIPGLFAKNERVVLHFETEHGPLALVLVGAMIVASMSTVFSGLVLPHGKQIIHREYPNSQNQHIHFNKGDEVGRFLLGSTVVMLLGNQKAQWDEAFKVGDVVRMGKLLGMIGA